MKKIISALVMLINLSGCSSQPETPANDDKNFKDAFGALFGAKINPDMTEVEKYLLGTEQNPVRVSGPEGSRAYLSRLICDNNEIVSAFARQGSAGISPYGTMMDVYVVICDTNKGAVEHTLFIDMYHNDYEEQRPAKGFIGLK